MQCTDLLAAGNWDFWLSSESPDHSAKYNRPRLRHIRNYHKR